MLRADAMMDAAQPSFKVGKYEMNDGHERFGNLWIAPLRDGRMFIAVLGESGVATASSRIDLGAKLSLSYLNRCGHEGFMVNASPLSTRTTANQSLIDLDDFAEFPADPVLIWADHTGTQLVEYLEGSFVTGQSKLPLKLDSRYAGCLTGDQVGCPEPYREWRMRALHHGTSGESSFAAALVATQNTRSGGVTIWFTGRPTAGTDETTTPSCSFKVFRTRCIIREQALKLRQRMRERQIVTFQYVNCHADSRRMQMLNIVSVGSVCDNRKPCPTWYEPERLAYFQPGMSLKGRL